MLLRRYIRAREAERLCSRIGVIKDGRIAHDATIPKLLALVPDTRYL
jgi:ABC-type multidrug transport system ATPase subunit